MLGEVSCFRFMCVLLLLLLLLLLLQHTVLKVRPEHEHRLTSQFQSPRSVEASIEGPALSREMLRLTTVS